VTDWIIITVENCWKDWIERKLIKMGRMRSIVKWMTLDYKNKLTSLIND
jgi:hypothetical protein